jgi:hypothetical protein
MARPVLDYGRPAPEEDLESSDPIPRRQRYTLAAMTIGLIAIAASIAGFSPKNQINPLALMCFAGLCSAGATAGIVLARKALVPGVRKELWFLRRVAIAGPAVVGAVAASFFVLPTLGGVRGPEQLATTWLACFVGFFLINYGRDVEARRRARVSFGPLILAAVFGSIFTPMFGGITTVAVGILAATSLASQIASPFVPRRRGTFDGAGDVTGSSPTRIVPLPPLPPMPPIRLPEPAAPTSGASAPATSSPTPAPALSAAALAADAEEAYETRSRISRRKAGAVFGFFGHLILFLSLLVGLLVALDFPGFISAGLLDRGFKANLDNEFGPAAWPGLMLKVGNIITYVGIALAAVTIMLSRRWQGNCAMASVIIACIGFLGAIHMLDDSLPGSWPAAVAKAAANVNASAPSTPPTTSPVARRHPNGPQASAALAQYLDAARSRTAIFSLAVFVVSLLMLAAPGKSARAEKSKDKKSKSKPPADPPDESEGRP